MATYFRNTRKQAVILREIKKRRAWEIIVVDKGYAHLKGRTKKHRATIFLCFSGWQRFLLCEPRACADIRKTTILVSSKRHGVIYFRLHLSALVESRSRCNTYFCSKEHFILRLPSALCGVGVYKFTHFHFISETFWCGRVTFF